MDERSMTMMAKSCGNTVSHAFLRLWRMILHYCERRLVSNWRFEVTNGRSKSYGNLYINLTGLLMIQRPLIGMLNVLFVSLVLNNHIGSLKLNLKRVIKWRHAEIADQCFLQDVWNNWRFNSELHLLLKGSNGRNAVSCSHRSCQRILALTLTLTRHSISEFSKESCFLPSPWLLYYLIRGMSAAECPEKLGRIDKICSESLGLFRLYNKPDIAASDEDLH